MLTGKMKSVHYGWVVCAVCALALFCTSGLSVNAFTVYQPYLIQNAGLSNTESSAIITVRSLFSFASVFFVGAFYRAVSLRAGLTLAMAIEATGFLLFGLGSDFWCYCLAASLVGCAYGVGTMVPVTMLVNRWFEDRRSVALGICAAATGLSTVGVPSLITWSVENVSLLTTFSGEALFMLLCGVICLALVRDTPERKQSAPYRSKEANKVKVAHVANNRALEPRTWVAVIPPGRSLHGRFQPPWRPRSLRRLQQSRHRCRHHAHRSGSHDWQGWIRPASGLLFDGNRHTRVRLRDGDRSSHPFRSSKQHFAPLPWLGVVRFWHKPLLGGPHGVGDRFKLQGAD